MQCLYQLRYYDKVNLFCANQVKFYSNQQGQSTNTVSDVISYYVLNAAYEKITQVDK